MNYDERRVRILATMNERGLSRADGCRAVCDCTLGQYAHVTKVLRGDERSEPMLARFEAWLELDTVTA